ncbi:MAG: hypothetical protein A3C81_01480 [Candidatus Yanofskybacteria bacterium RIFCSPHIGHO2_02_FULL_46_19]|uniref:Uncharacterized protein n=1 Tax=Candidatus Yanofskybacteria bacterium RIFCSPHIGHO2_02_FULL_46_19 TaxID=1802684 RepID=A0A1F8FSE4_9BACT|nr:MAG: hypothetical protein A3C81_01480 [Candidatus Yanofskybacteria bacterium RIFCSPHIGHO2_02_FULL_46_19]
MEENWKESMMKKPKSKCHNAKVKLDGVPDFIGSKAVCTVSYICSLCGQPCDVIHRKTKRRASIRKKYKPQ